MMRAAGRETVCGSLDSDFEGKAGSPTPPEARRHQAGGEGSAAGDPRHQVDFALLRQRQLVGIEMNFAVDRDRHEWKRFGERGEPFDDGFQKILDARRVHRHRLHTTSELRHPAREIDGRH